MLMILRIFFHRAFTCRYRDTHIHPSLFFSQECNCSYSLNTKEICLLRRGRGNLNSPNNPNGPSLNQLLLLSIRRTRIPKVAFPLPFFSLFAFAVQVLQQKACFLSQGSSTFLEPTFLLKSVGAFPRVTTVLEVHT